MARKSLAKQKIIDEVWGRYENVLKGGHKEFMDKAGKCAAYVTNDQWAAETLAKLREQGRPALTINIIAANLAHILGEQINNRTDVVFMPRGAGATEELARTLTAVYRHVADNNDLDHLRSDVFADGIITSRGFFDVRLDFTENGQGEVKITSLDPDTVLIDPDATSYDPREWNDVMIHSFHTLDDIEVMYGAAARRSVELDSLRYTTGTAPDSCNRFAGPRGTKNLPVTTGGTSAIDDTQDAEVNRLVKVVERQVRRIVKRRYFVDLNTGTSWPVPEEMGPEEVSALTSDPANPRQIVERMGERIRWIVVAGDTLLHDEWSPYEHFTVVPFFPYFFRGRSQGMVEMLLSAQDMINKGYSQELHIINTTANSGWLVRQGALVNMTVRDLEDRGAESGVVIEVNDMDGLEKITPNTVPTGMDRITDKALRFVDTISNVTKYDRGEAREDVSAKSVLANQQASAGSLTKVFDNLARSDRLLAQIVLSLIQRYYTNRRVMYITEGVIQKSTTSVEINAVDEETGVVHNDMSAGRYGLAVVTQPASDLAEDSQFQQIVQLMELGVPVPHELVVKYSRLQDKQVVLEMLQAQAQSPEAQAQADQQNRLAEAEIADKEAGAMQKQAKAQETMGQDMSGQAEMRKAEQEFAIKKQELEMEYELKLMELQQEMKLKEMEMQQEMQLKEQQAAVDRQATAMQAQAQAVAAKRAAMQPQQGAQAGGNAPAASVKKPASKGEGNA